MAALGPDGASHEGVGYWEYGVEYMLKFMDLARQRLDVDLYGNEWWRNTSAYAQYLALPRNAWTRGELHRGHRRLPSQPLVWPGVPAAGVGAAISRRTCAVAGPADRRGGRLLGQGRLVEPPLVRPRRAAEIARDAADDAPLPGHGDRLRAERLVGRRVAGRVQVRAVHRSRRHRQVLL